MLFLKKLFFLIQHILPAHVADFYLMQGHCDELYAQKHKLCGVMFASIPNFQSFYSEDFGKGKECLRILNEIICDFDAMLEETRFSSIEKIKTVGSTYMVASGLNPQKSNDNVECVCDLVEFAIAMQQSLDELNKHAFTLFSLRVGGLITTIIFIIFLFL